MRKLTLIAILTSAGLQTIPVSALGAPPDAGALLNERQNERRATTPEPRDNALPLEQSSTEPQSGDVEEALRVDGYMIQGNTLLSREDIEQTLLPFTDKNLTLTEIHQAANALQQRYRDKGAFAARVLIPPQAVTDHIITMNVYEGRLAENGVALSNPGHRVGDDEIHDVLVSNLATGEVLNDRALERALLLAGDLPGINVRSELLPATQPGEAILHIETRDEPLAYGDIYIDNYGGYYTGEARLGASAYVNSPAGRGDRLRLDAITSGAGSNYIYAQYDAPAGGSGLRLGASLDYLNYELGEELESQNAEGSALEARALISYPMIRSLDHNLYFNGSLAYLTLDDDNDLYGPADRTINKAMLGVHGDAETHLLNPGELYYSFELTAGNLTIDDGQAFASFDEQFVETEGSFITLRYRLSHLMHLHGPFSTAVDLTGQVASGNLDTSQKFFIGGPYDVAGYPVSEASGDQGAMIKADLRYDMPEGFLSSDTQLTLFYAQASTDIHKDPWAGWEGGNPLIRNRITLKTAGVSSHSTWGGHYMLNLTVGRQVGDNLGRDPATENDSDQSDADYRAWAQFAYFF